MTKTARNAGLFDWLKPAPEAEAAVQNPSDAALEATVVALFNEQEETAAAPAQAAERKEMFALLDALSAAERMPAAAPHAAATQASAPQAMIAPTVPPVLDQAPAQEDATMMPYSMPAMDMADDFGEEGAYEGSIHSLPAEGWLISQLQYDAEPMQQPAAPVAAAPVVQAPVAEAPMPAPIAVVEVVAPSMAAAATGNAMASPLLRTTPPVAETPSAKTGFAAPFAPTAEMPASDAFTMEAPAMEAAPATESFTMEAVSAPSPQLTAEAATATQLEIMATVANLADKAEQSAVVLAQTLGKGFAALRKAMPSMEQITSKLPQSPMALAPVALPANAPLPMSTQFSSLTMPSMPNANSSARYSAEAVEALLRMPEASLAPRVERQVQEITARRQPSWVEEKMALHHRWLESQGSEGKRFRYNGEDLSNVSFAGQHLPQAQFRGAPLAGMDFRQAMIEGADFAEADLSRANLSDAHANRANFTRSNLQFSDLQNLEAEGANFNFTDLHGARMRDAQFSGSSFREANFQGVVAMDVVLMNANMRGVQLFETIFPGADLRGADMRNARLQRTVFTGAFLAGASLKDAELIDIDYSQADFTTALDVPQEVQLMALGAERTKLNTARTMLEGRLSALQLREQKLLANLRVLEQKRHQDSQLEKQENEVFTALARHATWLWRGSFWWAGIIAGVVALASFAISVTPVAEINFPVLGSIATFVVVTAALAVLSFLRVWQVRRGLMQLLRHRQAMKAALSAQAAVEVATAEAIAADMPGFNFDDDKHAEYAA